MTAGFQEAAFQYSAFGGGTPTKTILEMVQQAQMELGLPLSSDVFTTNDASGLQMSALANRTIDELRRKHPVGWSSLQAEYNIKVGVPVSTTGNMAAGSNVITGIPSTSSIVADYFSVTGSGIPQGARVVSVDSVSQVTLNMYNTNKSDVTGTTLLFSQDTYPIPVGFDWFQNRSMWDRTNRWELIGPDSPQMDQWHRSGIVATGPRRHFRRVGPGNNCFRLWPPPAEISAPIQLVFEYMSLFAVVQAATSNTYAQYFTANDDQALLDEGAIIMGIKWMFWEAKGFGAYVPLQNRWVDYVDRLIARDKAAPTLSLNKRVYPIFISPANVQDGFFPSGVDTSQGL